MARAVKVTLGPKGRNALEALQAEAILRNRKVGLGRNRAMTATSAVEFDEALYANKHVA